MSRCQLSVSRKRLIILMKIILKYLIFVQMGIIKNWYESVISRTHMINSFWLMEIISQHMSIVITTATSNFRLEQLDKICRRSFKNALPEQNIHFAFWFKFYRIFVLRIWFGIYTFVLLNDTFHWNISLFHGTIQFLCYGCSICLWLQRERSCVGLRTMSVWRQISLKIAPARILALAYTYCSN